MAPGALDQRPLIAHILFRFDVGGLENGVVNLINGLPEGEFRHAIIALTVATDFRNRLRRADVSVHELHKRPGKDPAAYLRLHRLLRGLRPDATHTRNLGTLDCNPVVALAGVRVRIHGEHGWDASDPQGRSRAALRMRRICRPFIHQYVAMSKDLERWLEADVGIDAGRIEQIYNGVDADRFDPLGAVPVDLPWPAAGPGRPVVVGTVGRLDPIKNHERLLDAFAGSVRRIPQEQRSLRLMVVGEGPQRGVLEASASRLGIEPFVWMTGSRVDIPALMRAMDVFVLPSLNEGISNTILEAMASGLPVVAGTVGGNPEIVADGVTGALYDPGQSDGLENALLHYVESEDLRRRHGAAGRERAVREFSLSAMIERYAALYRKAFGGRQWEAASGMREVRR